MDCRVVTRLHGQTSEERTGSQVTTHLMFFAASVCLAIVVLDSALAQPPGDHSAHPGRRSDHRGLSGLHASHPSLRLTPTPLRLQPGPGYGKPGAFLHELEVLRQVCTVMRARRAQLVALGTIGHSVSESASTKQALRSRADQLDESSIVTQAIATRAAIASHRPDTTSTHRKINSTPSSGRYVHAMVAPAHQPRTRDRGRLSRSTATKSSMDSTTTTSGSSRRSSPMRAPTSTTCPSGRRAALRGRQQVPPGHPRHAHGPPNRMLFLTLAARPTHPERGRRHRAPRPRPLQGRERHPRPCHR